MEYAIGTLFVCLTFHWCSIVCLGELSPLPGAAPVHSLHCIWDSTVLIFMNELPMLSLNNTCVAPVMVYYT